MRGPIGFRDQAFFIPGNSLPQYSRLAQLTQPREIRVMALRKRRPPSVVCATTSDTSWISKANGSHLRPAKRILQSQQLYPIARS